MAELRKVLTDLSADHNTVPSYFQALLSTSVETPYPAVSEICISLLMSDGSLLYLTERSRFYCGPTNLQHTD
jgi:hypothetical protein